MLPADFGEDAIGRELGGESLRARHRRTEPARHFDEGAAVFLLLGFLGAPLAALVEAEP